MYGPHWKLSGMIDGGDIDCDDIEGSRILKTANKLRCFTGRFTELSESKLPNSTVTGVT